MLTTVYARKSHRASSHPFEGCEVMSACRLSSLMLKNWEHSVSLNHTGCNENCSCSDHSGSKCLTSFFISHSVAWGLTFPVPQLCPGSPVQWCYSCPILQFWEEEKKKNKQTITTDEPNKSILKLCIFIEYTELEGTHKDQYWNNTELYVQNCIALATFLQITVSIHTLKAYNDWSEGQRYYKIEFMFLPRELCTIFSIITT